MCELEAWLSTRLVADLSDGEIIDRFQGSSIPVSSDEKQPPLPLASMALL